MPHTEIRAEIRRKELGIARLTVDTLLGTWRQEAICAVRDFTMPLHKLIQVAEAEVKAVEYILSLVSRSEDTNVADEAVDNRARPGTTP